MNIFAIDEHPIRAAHQMVDKHVVKMILEAGQMKNITTEQKTIDASSVGD
jgi:hypothetical protein